jgi:hypothetical protein
MCCLSTPPHVWVAHGGVARQEEVRGKGMVAGLTWIRRGSSQVTDDENGCEVEKKYLEGGKPRLWPHMV